MTEVQGRRGLMLAERYRLVRVLGQGGMGTVWAARDEVLGREVAVKEVVPPPELPPSERRLVRYRTLREARAAARISHACAVTVYDVVESQDRLWIVMEKLDARNLAEVLKNSPLPPARVAHIGICLVDALGAAHAAGVLHRDVKPANVMIMRDGRAVLTDFGIATVDGDPQLTATGLVVGSPEFMAPERARGEPPTSASDLWSLGATLFAAVQGRSPFQREGQLSTLSAVISEEPPPASDAGPLRPVIERLLRKQPGERPTIPQARAMLEAAEREMDAATTAPTPSRPAVARSAAHPRPHTEQPETTNQPETTAPLPTPRPTREQVQAGPTARAVTQPSAPAPTQPAAPAASAQVRSASLAAAPGSVAAPQAPDVVASAAPVKVPNPSAPASPAPPPARVPEESGEPAPSPPGKPEESQPLEPYPVRRGRRRWLTVGIPAVLLGLAALVAGLLMRGGAAPSSAPPVGPRTGTAGASVTASTSVPTPSASASAGAGQTSAGSTSKSSPSKNPSVVVPAGFHLFKDPSGFQVAIPDGWTRSRVSTRTYFKEPGGRRFLQVDQTTHPKADALADWRRQEVAVSQRFSGYQRIRMERVQYRGWNAADWEFTWQPGSGQLHVLSRNIRVSDRGAYALYWSVPSAQWSPSQRYFDTFAATFQPAADHR